MQAVLTATVICGLIPVNQAVLIMTGSILTESVHRLLSLIMMLDPVLLISDLSLTFTAKPMMNLSSAPMVGLASVLIGLIIITIRYLVMMPLNLLSLVFGMTSILFKAVMYIIIQMAQIV